MWRATLGLIALSLWSSLNTSCDAPAPSRRAGARSQALQKAKPSLVSGQVPVAPFVRAQLANASGPALVYVGATWCEPCQHFHDALVKGELDALLAGMTVIEYDLDASRDALVEAGYQSRLIPLFVRPNADGTASEQRIEGSIKGERAVPDNLAPRLQQMLAR